MAAVEKCAAAAAAAAGVGLHVVWLLRFLVARTYMRVVGEQMGKVSLSHKSVCKPTSVSSYVHINDKLLQ